MEMINSQKGFVSSHKNEGQISSIEKLNTCEHISVNDTTSIVVVIGVFSHRLCLYYSYCSKGPIGYMLHKTIMFHMLGM